MSIPVFSRKTLMKATDSLIGAALCLTLGVFDYLLGRETNARGTEIADIKRILIIRPGGLGDMLVLLPVFKALKNKFADAVIDVVCERRNLEVLEMAGLAENALVYDSNPFRFFGELRRRSYDVSLDSEQFHNFSAVFGRISGSPVRIGFKISPKRNLLYTHLINYELDGPEGRQFSRLLSPLGIKASPSPLSGTLRDLDFSLPRSILEKLSDAAGANGFVAIHPGTSTAYKLWRNDNFVEVVQSLREEHGLGAVLVGGKGEEGAAMEIQRRAESRGCTVLSFVGSVSLSTTAAIARRSAMFIGADSGIAHLAVALGLRTVVLFGASDHRKWGVKDASHAVVRAPMPCSPCFIFGYHKLCRTFDCMEQIVPEDVLDACRRVLKA